MRYITRSRLSLNIPGVPLTSPSKRESRVTRKRNGRKGSVEEKENKEEEEEEEEEKRVKSVCKGKKRNEESTIIGQLAR